MRSDAFVHPTAAAALVAVWRGARTVREVAGAVGCSIASAHHWLTVLQGDGLVDWEEGKSATIHALVREVQVRS